MSVVTRAQGKRQARYGSPKPIQAEDGFGFPMLASAPELLAAFHDIAGQIIDTQIGYKPGQNGRWDIPAPKKSPSGVHQIEFSIFPADTIFTLKSANHNVVSLGLKAAALAISLVAWNWVEWQAHDAGRNDIAKQANKFSCDLMYFVFRSKKPALTSEEQHLIHRYID
jgi:hypothetical protein